MTSSSEFPDLKYLEREDKMEAMTHPPTEAQFLVSTGTSRERQFEMANIKYREMMFRNITQYYKMEIPDASNKSFL